MSKKLKSTGIDWDAAEEIAKGINLYKRPCADCQGFGLVASQTDDRVLPCPACLGQGEIPYVADEPDKPVRNTGLKPPDPSKIASV